MIIGCTDQHGRGDVEIEWKDPRRNKIKLEVNSKLKLAIKKTQWIKNGLEVSSWSVILHFRPSLTMTHQTLFSMQMNLYMGVNAMIGVWCNFREKYN